MNLGTWPDGVPYDPADGVDSLELEAIISGPGGEWPAVVLGAGERARRSGWAARAAISIAEAWSRGSRRVVLADLCLDRPELHEHLDEPNSEGLADIFVYGASPGSVVHRRAARSFDFLPPGVYIPDAREIYRSREWPKLLRALRTNGTLLIAYAPLEADGFADLVERLRQVIVLTTDPAAARSSGALADSPVQLLLRPVSPPSAAELVDDEDDDEPGIARRPPPEPDDASALALEERAAEEERVALDAAAAEAGEAESVAPAAEGESITPAAEAGSVTPAAEAASGPESVGRAAAEPAAEPESVGAAAAEPAAETRADAPEPVAPAAKDAREVAPAARLSDAEFERLRVPRAGEREALIADLRQRQREAMLVPPPGAERPREAAAGARPTAEQAEAAERAAAAKPTYPAQPPELIAAPTEPDFTAAQQPRREQKRRRRVMVATLLAVAVLSVIGGAWHFVGSWLEQRRAVAPPTAAPPPATTAPAPAAQPELLRYSVAIEAHQNLDIALERVDALRAEETRFNFYITPVLVNGNLFYRLMAGPVADSASAAAMMDALLAAGHKTGASPADIRTTPLAFHLGSLPSRAEAERRVDELRTLAIPAYVVMQQTPGGVIYRVYGGGYTSPAEAEVMRELLRTTGQPDSLVERMGSAPQ